MQPVRLSPNTSDSLGDLINKTYPHLSAENKKKIALQTLFSNPALALSLLPPTFWTAPQQISPWEMDNILKTPFGTHSTIIELPAPSSQCPMFSPHDFTHHYDFSSMLNYPAPERRHSLISETSLRKIATNMLTAIRKSALNALLQDTEVLQAGAVSFFTNMEVAFPKILKYLGAKFEAKIIEGEKFFFVYGSKKINEELEILLQGSETDTRIISIGFGSAAANKIVKTGTPVAILVVASFDIFKHVFKKQENMADLLTEMAIDIPQAAALNIGSAAVSLILGSEAFIGITLPLLVFGGAIVVVGIIAVASATLIMNSAGYKKEPIHNFIIKHHIDLLINKSIYNWEKLNYESFKHPHL